MSLILMLTEKQIKKMWNWITKKRCQNEKLLENLRKYDEKEKIKQQESKVYGQKPVKERGRNKKTRVYNS